MKARHPAKLLLPDHSEWTVLQAEPELVVTSPGWGGGWGGGGLCAVTRYGDTENDKGSFFIALVTAHSGREVCLASGCHAS